MNKFLLIFLFLLKTLNIQACNSECDTCSTDQSFCLTCAAEYYPIQGSPNICMQISDQRAKGYYLDQTDNMFKQCYYSCATCSEAGNINNHNCETCLTDYFMDENNNCNTECPSDYFKQYYTCVKTCTNNFYLNLIDRSCVQNCNSGYSEKNDDLGLCTITNTTEYRNYNCSYIINEIIIKNFDFFISDKSFIRGKNCYIQVYNAIDENKIHNLNKNGISKLYLNSDYSKNNIIAIKVDYNQTYNLIPEVNDITFKLYEKTKNTTNNANIYTEIKLDLSTVVNENKLNDVIYIEKPFININIINKYYEKFKIFDLFNARNEKYNDFCLPFTSEYGTDVTFDFRREVYFVNLTYCANDSTIYYGGFNPDNNTIICKANYLENKFIEKNMGKSRFKIFKCRNFLTKGSNLVNYIGFWFVFIIILCNIGLLVPFFIICYRDIQNFMRIFEREYNKPTGIKLRWIKLNPPKKKIKFIHAPQNFILPTDNNENVFSETYINEVKNKIKAEKNKNVDKIHKNLKLLSGSISQSSESSQSDYVSNSEKNSEKNSKNSESQNTNSENDSNSFSNKNKPDKKKKFVKYDLNDNIYNKMEKEKAYAYKSCIMPDNQINYLMTSYEQKEKELEEKNKIKNTNLIKLDEYNNVTIKKPEDKCKVHYEPKMFLEKYKFHNFGHLLPPPIEKESNGTLSSEMRKELLKLQQLREKKMVEKIFFKNILSVQQLIKGYNEDFYPFSYDECILRRKETITYGIVFWNYLREVNLIVNIIFDENYLDNRILKIILFLFSFYCQFFFNLLFFSDNYIDNFYINKGEYSFFYQLTKNIAATLASFVLVKACSFLLSSKSKLRKIIMTRKYESDEIYIVQYKKYLRELTFKICCFYLILVIFLIFGWYYFCCFCVPYRNTQKYVLAGGFISIIINNIFSIIVCAIIGFIRYTSIVSKNKKFYKFTYIMNYIV